MTPETTSNHLDKFKKTIMKENKFRYTHLFAALCLALGLAACGPQNTATDSAEANENSSQSAPNSETSAAAPAEQEKDSGLPTFSLAWSEYPSWSTFGVAHIDKFINGKKGELGSLEEKWQVDVVLHEAEYDACITMYGAGTVDAACLTNMDALNPAIARPSTMILPTSTSHGADACIVVDSINSIQDLKGKKVYGLEKTVSEYCFVRNLEMAGEKEKDYQFSNMDPAAAAAAMQQKQDGVDGIVVWNPFVMETLSKRDDVKVLFDSTKIPGEIIDSVIMAQDSLAKEGGEAFACAIIDAFYTIANRMNQPDTRNDTLIALGEKFSNLGLDAMNTVVRQTKFISTPAEAITMFNSQELPQIMKRVVDFCVDHEITGRSPALSFGIPQESDQAELRFDPSYIQKVTMKQ